MEQFPAIALLLALVLGAWTALADDPQVFEDHVTLYSENATGFGSEIHVADFNNNDLPDLIIGEPVYEIYSGRVLVYLDAMEIENGIYEVNTSPFDLQIVGQQGDNIGENVCACDFNGDQISDILLTRFKWGGRSELLYIFYGGDHWESGTTITDIDADADVIIIPNEENEDRIRGVFLCEDLSDDGFSDILVGWNPVLVLGDDYPSGSLIDLNISPPAVRFAGNYSYYRKRFFGDVNGDGRQDFLFSDDSFAGEIRIWFGFDDYLAPRVIDPGMTPPDVSEEGPYIYAYYRIMDVGDWNSDGADDLWLIQAYSETHVIYRMNPGLVGMLPGHEFIYQFAVMTPLDISWGDLNGDDQFDLLAEDDEFYWDRSQFPQTGNWDLEDYDPQGIHSNSSYRGKTQTAYLDSDGIPDAIFWDASTYGTVTLSFTGPRPGDDDDDTGDDDTGDDDTGDDDTGDDDTGDDDTGDDDTGDDDTGDDDTGDDDTGDDDTGDDDTGDDDTGDDDTGDDDTGDDDTGDDDTGDDDTGDDDTGDDDTGDDDTGPDDDDDDNNDDDDDGCCG